MMEVHLIVLVHGMWGNVHHFAYAHNELVDHGAVSHENGPFDVSQLREKGETIVVYRTHSNQGYFTYDGIDVCGTRVANEIQSEIAEIERAGAKVVRLSLAGYSMGGMIVRYASGVLYTRKVFDTVIPHTMTTFCSPHVGANMLGTRLSQRLFNFIGSWSMARTSRQVFLRDAYAKSGTPLFKHMTDEASPYMLALRLFHKRALYANIVNDRRCDWYTAAAEATDPWIPRAKLARIAGPFAGPQYAPVVLKGVEPQFTLEPSPKTSSPSQPNRWRNIRIVMWLLRALRVSGVVLRVSVVLPIWFVAFLINAGYQTIASGLRVRSMVESGDHIPPYDFTAALENQADSMVEDVYTTVADPGVLRVTPVMRSIIDQFNSAGWEKYPIHITGDANAHAAAIVRIPTKKSMAEGKQVIAHWINEVLAL